MMTGTTSSYNQPQSSSNADPYGCMTATGKGSPYYQDDSSQSLKNQSQILQPGPMMDHPTLQYSHQQPLFMTCMPSKSSNYPYCDSDPQGYCDYFYQYGFLKGHYSDITVRITGLRKTFALHSLILSRSPYLRQRMDRLQTPVLELDHDRASSDAFDLIFSHLYRPFTQHDILRLVENPHMYLQLIDLAHYFQLDGLQQVLVQTIEFDETNVIRWSAVLYQHGETAWIKDLEERLIQYLARDLIKTLPQHGLVIGQHQTVMVQYPDSLLTLYAALPLDYMKRCLDCIPDPLQRYRLATQVLERQSGTSLGLRFDQQRMTMEWIKTPQRKLGKWNPSLYNDMV